MKKLSQPVRLLVWAGFGLIIGAVAALILTVALTPVWGMSATNLCFYLGLIVLIIGLFASTKGNPRHNTVGSADKGYFNAHVVVDEEASTKAIEKHYHENRVVDANAFGFCLIPAGIIMVFIAYLASIGRI